MSELFIGRTTMATANDAVLAQAIYDAFYKAALAMSDDELKAMSWFGRNVRAVKAAA